jgi:hypothetical protein
MFLLSLCTKARVHGRDSVRLLREHLPLRQQLLLHLLQRAFGSIEFISLAFVSIIPTAAMIYLNRRFARSPTALTSPHAMALSAASSSPPFTLPALISCARPYALVQPPLLRTTSLHLCFQTGLNSVCEGPSFTPVQILVRTAMSHLKSFRSWSRHAGVGR